MAALRATLDIKNPGGQGILNQTVSAIRDSMEAGLKMVFILGAVAMLLTFLIICTLPEISVAAPE